MLWLPPAHCTITCGCGTRHEEEEEEENEEEERGHVAARHAVANLSCCVSARLAHHTFARTKSPWGVIWLASNGVLEKATPKRKWTLKDASPADTKCQLFRKDLVMCVHVGRVAVSQWSLFILRKQVPAGISAFQRMHE